MRTWLFGLILLSLISAGCTRRPEQKDVVIQGPPQNSTDRSEDIQSTRGAPQAPIDLQCIDTLVRMHLSAIDAEQLVKTRAGHVELKQFAASRLIEQQSEIASSKQLRSDLFGNADQAQNVELPGVRDALQAVAPEKLDLLKENGFDVEFVKQMLAHDEGVLAFARDLISRDIHPDLKLAVQKIIDEKTGEIEQMQQWRKDWERNG